MNDDHIYTADRLHTWRRLIDATTMQPTGEFYCSKCLLMTPDPKTGECPAVMEPEKYV